MDAYSALWTFPAIILAAILIAWAAECGQFYISQGLALAVLAWIQTLPEFAVEAVIAWEAAKDPAKAHLITANFTGSLRLFVGLGWPMVYFVSAFFDQRKKAGHAWFRAIRMDDEHAIAVISLLPALAFFLVIYCKGTLTILDGLILMVIYSSYLYLLAKMPPQKEEGIEDLGRIPRSVMGLKTPWNYLGIILFFMSGAIILYFAAKPFLHSMLAVAMSMGISQFVFVQWVAPFLSEFPEKLSAFHWARKVSKAPMALINFVSSSINQWTVLVGIIPFIYSFGLGRPSAIYFDPDQKREILLTIAQSYLGFLFLARMEFRFVEALGLLILWLIQFITPEIRQEITYVYGGWAGLETVRLLIHTKRRNAFNVFAKIIKEQFFNKCQTPRNAA